MKDMASMRDMPSSICFITEEKKDLENNINTAFLQGYYISGLDIKKIICEKAVNFIIRG